MGRRQDGIMHSAMPVELLKSQLYNHWDGIPTVIYNPSGYYMARTNHIWLNCNSGVIETDDFVKPGHKCHLFINPVSRVDYVKLIGTCDNLSEKTGHPVNVHCSREMSKFVEKLTWLNQEETSALKIWTHSSGIYIPYSGYVWTEVCDNHAYLFG